MAKRTYSEDIRSALEDDNEIRVIERELPEIHHKMTIYPIVRGIYLVSHEIEGFIMPFEKNNSGIPLYTINYCLSGRCEFRKTDDKVSYLSPGIVCIGKKENLSSFYYPLGHYTGYEIYFIESLYDTVSLDFLKRFELDRAVLFERYTDEDSVFIGKISREQDLFKTVAAQGCPRLGNVRSNVIRLLQELQFDDALVSFAPNFITPYQRQLANMAHDILIKDLSVHIPVRTISDQFGISETYLKNCFKEVYGLCISEYMASYRMREAARLLTGTDMSILEIAGKVGYTNQGRFAKVFRDHYRMKPLKYRHSV